MSVHVEPDGVVVIEGITVEGRPGTLAFTRGRYSELLADLVQVDWRTMCGCYRDDRLPFDASQEQVVS